jgi:hypothetical protein
VVKARDCWFPPHRNQYASTNQKSAKSLGFSHANRDGIEILFLSSLFSFH